MGMSEGGSWPIENSCGREPFCFKVIGGGRREEYQEKRIRKERQQGGELTGDGHY